jgi:hypothetical protein
LIKAGAYDDADVSLMVHPGSYRIHGIITDEGKAPNGISINHIHYYIIA